MRGNIKPIKESVVIAAQRALSDDRKLFAEIISGNQEAFRQLYHRHVKTVYWYSLKMLKDPNLAEDNTQEVFITCWEKRKKITLADSSLLPWLLTTAKYHSLNRKRKLAKLEESLQLFPELSSADQAVDEQAEQSQLLSQIHQIVSNLTETDQRIYQSCIVDGESYETAAKLHGVSQSAVRNRLAKIRNQIRGKVKPI